MANTQKDTEEWSPIKGYEGLYEVSTYGRVKSLSRTMPHETFGTWNIKERILKQHWAGPKSGQYKIVWLHKGKGEQHSFRVHRLVAETFIDNPEQKEQVNHIDCDRENNAVWNLEWATPKENTVHAVLNGRFEEHLKRRRKAVVNVDTGEMFDSVEEAAEAYGVTHRAIWQVLMGKNQKCKGCRWQYAEEYNKGLPVRNEQNKTVRAVVQMDKETGEEIATYKSISEAERTTGGYKWRYACG